MIFQGIWASIAKELDSFVIFLGWDLDPPGPAQDQHMTGISNRMYFFHFHFVLIDFKPAIILSKHHKIMI